MSRRDDAPSVCIIGNKRYILEKRCLLCEICISNPVLLVDLFSKTQRLYCPKGKAFILKTVSDFTGAVVECKILSKQQAQKFMDSHPEGINEKVYIRFFGEPKEL